MGSNTIVLLIYLQGKQLVLINDNLQNLKQSDFQSSPNNLPGSNTGTFTSE